MVIDANAADPPLSEHIRARGQGLERRPVDLLKQPTTRYAEPPDRPLPVEPREQLADRHLDLGEAVEGAMARATEQLALHDEHGLLDLGLVARLTRPRRQHGGAIMRRHHPIDAIDLRVVEARRDERDLGVVGHQERGHAADRGEGADVGADPVGEASTSPRCGLSGGCPSGLNRGS